MDLAPLAAQALAVQAVMSLDKPRHTNLDEMGRRQASRGEQHSENVKKYPF
jgi:hypothetical protein